MENKKEYAEPEMKIVHLDARINLLVESDETGGELGFAPHEQDPLA